MSLPSFRAPSGQSSAYAGVGQGMPSNRFSSTSQAPTRQASLTANTPLPPASTNLLHSPPGSFNRPSGAFAFGAAGSLTPGQSLSSAPEASLDPSDFPALGGGLPLPTSSQPPIQPNTAANATNSAQNPNNSNSLSSYAAQIAQSQQQQMSNLGATAQTANSALSGLTHANREFSPDDFPALGGFGAATSGPNAGNENQLNGAQLNPQSNGMNSLLAPSGNLSHSRQGAAQEQASAVAALQAQQQHRQNLLGNMLNGTSPSAASPRTPSMTSDSAEKRSQPQQQNSFGLKTSTPSNWINSAANSVLPPPANTSNSGNQTSSALLDALRSPSAATHPNNPPGVSLQRPVGAAASNLPALSNSAPNSSSVSNTTTSGGAASQALPPPANQMNPIPQTPAQQVLFSPADRFGLLGLLHLIKTTDPDLNMLALGSDLTSLGLDLGATDNLYSTFITPWSDSKAAAALNIEPEFHLPSCYNVQPPPAQTKIGNFSDETLFFIFYSQPRDAMQEMAAHELYKHNWRYHKELRLWLTKEAGTEPTQKTATYERGSYIIFDPTVWERVRKDFVLEFAKLA